MPRTIAVILPNWIGDVVMSTPTLRNLRQHVGPNAKIIGVAKPYIREVLTGSSWLDEMVWFAPKSPDRTHRTGGVIRKLRELQIDEAIILRNSLRAAWIPFRAGATQRVGYYRNARGFLLTDGLAPRKHLGRFEPVSAVDYYLDLLGLIGVGCAVASARAVYDGTGRTGSRPCLGKTSVGSPYDSVITLNTGGAYGAAKHWPNQHSAQLALKLVRDGHKVLIHVWSPGSRCGARDRGSGEELRGAEHGRSGS